MSIRHDIVHAMSVERNAPFVSSMAESEATTWMVSTTNAPRHYVRPHKWWLQVYGPLRPEDPNITAGLARMRQRGREEEAKLRQEWEEEQRAKQKTSD